MQENQQKPENGGSGVKRPMIWTNMQLLMSCLPQSQNLFQPKPQERWGHSSVSAHNKKMIIIGGYQAGLGQAPAQQSRGLFPLPASHTSITNIGRAAFQFQQMETNAQLFEREQQHLGAQNAIGMASHVIQVTSSSGDASESSAMISVTFSRASENAEQPLMTIALGGSTATDGLGIDGSFETHSSAEQITNESELMVEACIDGLSSPENTTNSRDKELEEQEEDEEEKESSSDDRHTTTSDEIEVTTDDLQRAMQLSESSLMSPYPGNHQVPPPYPILPINPFLISSEELAVHPDIQEISSSPFHPSLSSSLESSAISSPMQQHLNRIQYSIALPSHFQQQQFQQQPSLGSTQQQQHSSSSNIGQYLGDIWEFDFTQCCYVKHKAIGEDAMLLERSNHTAVFYPTHNAIYVFGGGQAQRLRFNDTLRLVLPQPSDNNPAPETQVSRFILREGSLIPCPRTYHASCLVGNYMIVSGGEANNTDLNDMWALDLNRACWFKFELAGNSFMSKRFHTVSALSQNRVVSFGGCHSEYIHLNDVNIFELDSFITSEGADCLVQCIKLDFSRGCINHVPSTRWGHAATVYQDKLYILGGRNNEDINDLHCFDINLKIWSQVEIGHPMPKPRRRHSAVFVSSTLVMFGGFDGEFFNDMHLLHFEPENFSQQEPTCLLEDYAKLVDSKEHSNIKFQLDPVKPGAPDQIVYANKSLVLFRLFEREIREYCQDSQVFQLRMEEVLTCPQTKSMCPQFFQRVFDAKAGATLRIPGISSRAEFLLFLEFCYCDRLVKPVTGAQIATIRHICQVLGLATVTQYFDSLAQHIQNKLQSELIKDFEAKVMQQLSTNVSNQGSIDNSLNPVSNLTIEQRLQLERSVQELLHTVKFHFNQLDNPAVVQSPEDRIEKQNNIIHAEMVKCRNLDHFFDVIFELDGKHLMRANSAVLHARCEYFRIMFDTKYGFQESSRQDLTLTNEVRHCGVRYVIVKGIPKQYFTAIIQFLYTDNFCQTECNLSFFLRLLIYADYFMIGRLSDLCQDILRQFVKPKNVMDLYLVAHAHNAVRLERYCISFLAINQQEIQRGLQWKDFQRKCKQYERTCLLEKVRRELEEEIERNFVSISLQRHVQKVTKTDWPKFDLGNADLPVVNHTASDTLITTSKEEDSSTPSQSATTRDGITLIQSTAPAKQKKGNMPSHRRDQHQTQVPTIVKVATNVTARIVEPSSQHGSGFTDADLDSIMAVPSYIYFEEHHPTESYVENYKQLKQRQALAQICNTENKIIEEEVKDEGVGVFGFKKPNPMVGNFMQPIESIFREEGMAENKNPNVALQQQVMITTTNQAPGWRQRAKKQQSAAQSAALSQESYPVQSDQQQQSDSSVNQNNKFWRF